MTDPKENLCRHWSDVSRCDIMCATCGHPCALHEIYAPSPCFEDGCACVAFVDPPAAIRPTRPG